MALGDDDLERVAGLDVLLGAPHVALVLLGGDLGLGTGRAGEAGHRADAVGQRPHQLRRDRVRVAVAAGLGDHLDRPADVVEDDHDVRDQEARGRRGVAFLALGQLHGRLEAADRVVGDVADSAAGERRQALPVGAGVLGERIAQRREHVAVRRGVERHRPAARAEERVAPDLLAALDGLEQEGRAAMTQAQERADRRQQIGGKLAHGRTPGAGAGCAAGGRGRGRGGDHRCSTDEFSAKTKKSLQGRLGRGVSRLGVG